MFSQSTTFVQIEISQKLIDDQSEVYKDMHVLHKHKYFWLVLTFQQLNVPNKLSMLQLFFICVNINFFVTLYDKGTLININ